MASWMTKWIEGIDLAFTRHQCQKCVNFACIDTRGPNSRGHSIEPSEMRVS